MVVKLSSSDEVDHVVVHPFLEPSVLEAKLDVHLGEFFRWCVLGAARYYAEGIDNEPRAAVASTSKFFSEQDVVVQFFDQAPLEHTGSERDGVPLQVLAMVNSAVNSAVKTWSEDSSEVSLSEREE